MHHATSFFWLSLFFGWLTLSAPVFAQGKSQRVYSLASPEAPVRVFSWQGQLTLVTRQAVYGLEKQGLVRRCRLEIPITSAALSQGVLWLGTRQGLYSLSSPRDPLLRVSLPAQDTLPAISQLTTDIHQTLWIATHQYGVFRLTKQGIEPMLAVYPANGIASTADGSVWVATSSGLYQSRTGEEWLRYAEEGISGQEIPDSQVDRVFANQDSVLWVVMPHAISFLHPLQHQGGHAPAYDYLGAPDNEIYQVLRTHSGQYLVATQFGLLLLASTPDHAHENEGIREIHPDFSHNQAHLLQAAELGIPAIWPKVFEMYEDEKGNLWLASAQGLVRVDRKKLAQVLDPRKEKSHVKSKGGKETSRAAVR